MGGVGVAGDMEGAGLAPRAGGHLLQPSPEAITVCTEGLSVGLVNSVQWNAVT